MHEISIIDVNGALFARFLRLDDSRYFGGLTAHGLSGTYMNGPDFGIPGPHAHYDTAGLLNVIARIANESDPRLAYELQGGLERMVIARQMRADWLAAVLQCKEDEVREHFDRLVTLTGGNRG